VAVDAENFDRWTQGLNARFSRRSLSGITAGALASLGLAATVDAKKKKKKKKKKNNAAPPPVAPGVNTTCNNLGFACGNTAICVCELDKNSVQTCTDQDNPPNGIGFFDLCQSNANCRPGDVCSLNDNVCKKTCAN
jgi:hypothetical protein